MGASVSRVKADLMLFRVSIRDTYLFIHRLLKLQVMQRTLTLWQLRCKLSEAALVIFDQQAYWKLL